jgi:hypothetical protein
MITAICCIAKCENDYLQEWVDYHLNLGFTHIYIYDNNDLDGERIEEVLDKHIDKNIFIIDCRGKKAYQATAYTKFYQLYGNKYDWIAYIVDEFITFSEKSGLKNINDFLKTFEDFEIIHLNWMTYGDNGIVDYTSNIVLDRFTKPLPFDMQIQYNFPENNHVKSIIRGGLNYNEITITPHSPSGNFKICDEKKVSITENAYFKPYSFDVIYIRHYTTKTIYEWIKKVSRGRATLNSKIHLYSFEKFFKYNNDTVEKRKVIKQYLFFKEVADSQFKTELGILKKDYNVLKQENFKLNLELTNIKNSKAYQLGKLLLRPFYLWRKYVSFKKN